MKTVLRNDKNRKLNRTSQNDGVEAENASQPQNFSPSQNELQAKIKRSQKNFLNLQTENK